MRHLCSNAALTLAVLRPTRDAGVMECRRRRSKENGGWSERCPKTKQNEERSLAGFQVLGHCETEDVRRWVKCLVQAHQQQQVSSRLAVGKRPGRQRFGRALAGRSCGCRPPFPTQAQLQRKNKPRGRVLDSASWWRTVVVVLMQQAESHGGRGCRGVLAARPTETAGVAKQSEL